MYFYLNIDVYFFLAGFKMTSRGGKSSQPFLVSFTVENGHLQDLQSQIVNFNSFLMKLGVLSFKLNGCEMLDFKPGNQFNGTESTNMPQMPAQSSSTILNTSTSLLESPNFYGISSIATNEVGPGKVSPRRDTLKPIPWKEEPAFRVPYPPLMANALDEKTVDYLQRNGTKPHEKSFAYPTLHNAISPPFGATATNSNVGSNQKINGIAKNRQSKKRKVQNEFQSPYFHASQNNYSHCRHSNPPHFQIDQMFNSKSFEHDQIYRQMPNIRSIPETNHLYNYPTGVPHQQMFTSHVSDQVLGTNHESRECKTDNALKQINEISREDHVVACNDAMTSDDKFMDADSLARLVDSGEELPDCLDLDGLLDFDLPEDLSVFETSCDSSSNNPFKIFPGSDPDKDGRSDASGKLNVEEEVVPSPRSEMQEKSRKRAREDKAKHCEEFDLPGNRVSKKSLMDPKSFPSYSAKTVSQNFSGNQGHLDEAIRCQMVPRCKKQIIKGSTHLKQGGERVSWKAVRPSENLLSSPDAMFSINPCNNPGLNSPAQSCLTPSFVSSAQHNFSPSINSDSDGSPRLSTDDDRSSSGGKTASLLLSPPNWGSDISAPSALEFYESSAFPRNDMLTAEVGFVSDFLYFNKKLLNHFTIFLSD